MGDVNVGNIRSDWPVGSGGWGGKKGGGNPDHSGGRGEGRAGGKGRWEDVESGAPFFFFFFNEDLESDAYV